MGLIAEIGLTGYLHHSDLAVELLSRTLSHSKYMRAFETSQTTAQYFPLPLVLSIRPRDVVRTAIIINSTFDFIEQLLYRIHFFRKTGYSLWTASDLQLQEIGPWTEPALLLKYRVLPSGNVEIPWSKFLSSTPKIYWNLWSNTELIVNCDCRSVSMNQLSFTFESLCTVYVIQYFLGNIKFSRDYRLNWIFYWIFVNTLTKENLTNVYT